MPPMRSSGPPIAHFKVALESAPEKSRPAVKLSGRRAEEERTANLTGERAFGCAAALSVPVSTAAHILLVPNALLREFR